MSASAAIKSVVKIGGSLAENRNLPELLELLTALPGAVVVAGGGGAANWIRRYSAEFGLNEEVSHRLSLLATELYARMLAELNPLLEPTADAEGLLFPPRGRTPVWLAEKMAMTSEMPKSWAVTSDTLALWLAGCLGISKVILLKATNFKQKRAGALSKMGAIDEYFPRLWAQKPATKTYILSPSHWRLLQSGDYEGLSLINA